MPSKYDQLERKRWLILILICLLNLCAGSIYAWSVLSTAAAQALTASTGQTVTAADLAIAFGVANSVGPLPMILGGAFNDRFGPRWVIVSGGILLGAGLFFCGLADSARDIILSYGILFGLGLGLAYGAGISTAIKYFPDRRGFAGGLVTAVYGFSSVIVPPVAQLLMRHFGIMNTFMILGVVSGVVIVICGLFCDRCPDDFVPSRMQGVSATTPGEGKTWKEMLASPIFYPMIVLLLCGCISGLMILSQAASIAEKEIGLSAVAASAAVSTIAFFNMTGRLIAGTLSDWLGRLGVLAAALACSCLGLLLLTTCSHGDTVLFYLGFILIGIAFGAFMGIYPGFTADRFGSKHAATNYGIMFCGLSIAGMLGPVIMRSMQQSGFDFAACCWVGIGFCLLGLVLTIICKKAV